MNSSEKSIQNVALILKNKGIDTQGKIHLIEGD